MGVRRVKRVECGLTGLVGCRGDGRWDGDSRWWCLCASTGDWVQAGRKAGSVNDAQRRLERLKPRA